MLVLAYLAVFPNQTDAGAEELETAVSDVIERYEAAVVSIARIVPDSGTALESAHKPLNRPISQLPKSEFDYVPNDFGTGFLISHPDRPDRYLLTNYHVVRGGPVYPQFITNDRSYLRIHFHDRRGAHAAMIAADPRSDLAVLRLDWEKSQLNQADFPVLNWEKGPAPRKGQFVVMMGNPHAIARDGSASVSWGMISNLTRQPVSFTPMLSQDQVEAS